MIQYKQLLIWGRRNIHAILCIFLIFLIRKIIFSKKYLSPDPHIEIDEGGRTVILSSLQRQNSEMDSGGSEPETRVLGCSWEGLVRRRRLRRRAP